MNKFKKMSVLNSLIMRSFKFSISTIFLLSLFTACTAKNFSSENTSLNSNANLLGSQNPAPFKTLEFDPNTMDLADDFKVGDSFTYLGLEFTITRHYHGDILISFKHPKYPGTLSLIFYDIWSSFPEARIYGPSCADSSIIAEGKSAMPAEEPSSVQFISMIDYSARNMEIIEYPPMDMPDPNIFFAIVNGRLCVPFGDDGSF